MSVLTAARVLLQAKNYSGSGDWLDEVNSHDGAFNGPLFVALHPAGGNNLEKTLFVPGPIANTASVPDATELDMTGDWDFRVRFRVVDWTPDTQQVIFSKWSSDKGYLLDLLNGSHDLRLVFHGGSVQTPQTTAQPSTVFSDGDMGWVQITGVVDGSNRNITFSTSTDDTNDHTAVSWTQLGDVVVVTNNSAMGLNTTDFFIGAQNNDSDGKPILAGNVAAMACINDGTVELDVRFDDIEEPFATFTERSANAATVTINRSGSALVSTIIDRDVMLLTTDDYFEISDAAELDIAADEDLSTMVVFRTNTVASGEDVLLAKKDNLTTSAGYALLRSTANAKGLIADGTADDDDTAATVAVHTLHSAAMVRDVTSDDVTTYLDGIPSGSATTDSTTSTLANALPLRIGATSNTAANFFEGEIIAMAQWPLDVALTDAEVLHAHHLLIDGAVPYPPFPRRLSSLVRM